MSSNRNRLVLALTVFLVGGFVAWRAVDRAVSPASDRGSSASGSQRASTNDPPRLSEEYLRPTARTVSEIAGDVERRVSDAFRSVDADARRALKSRSGGAGDAFAGLVAARLGAILGDEAAGDPEALAVAAGATRFSDPSPSLVQAVGRGHEQWREHWRMARLAPDRIRVRARRSEESNPLPHEGSGAMIRNLFRARFPEPGLDALVYEALIPVEAPTSRGDLIPATLGISYFWSDEEARWIGRNVTLSTYEAKRDAIPPM